MSRWRSSQRSCVNGAAKALAQHVPGERSRRRYGRRIALFKGDSRAHNYRTYVSGRLLGVSFMSLAELDRWSLERNWGAARKAQLATHLSKYTILRATRELCLIWAKVSWEARKKGCPIQVADAWIAASALYYQVPLITRNANDYTMISDLELLTAP
jgi:tRNA(fMet)-specific endonuclease VapC